MKTRATLFALLSIIMFGCSKKHKVECPPIPLANTDLLYMAPSFYFKIIDKLTSKDLFFSTPPTYDTSQLKYTIKVYNSTSGRDLVPVKLLIDSSRMSFSTFMRDTAFIQIANLTPDTLVFLSTKSIPAGPCNFLNYVDSVKFDGQKYAAGDKQVITLKK